MKNVFRRDIALARVALAVLGTGALGLAFVGQRQTANAFPKYATKEKKPCAYCHVKAQGGGARNEAGTYYGTHNHSFAGYKPAGAPTAKPTPKATPKSATKGKMGKAK